ncbi:MAG: hypothetical protein L0H59_18205 [Tomitella sp.]|nr:hypothetical protein [Tomitella sp.]
MYPPQPPTPDRATPRWVWPVVGLLVVLVVVLAIVIGVTVGGDDSDGDGGGIAASGAALAGDSDPDEIPKASGGRSEWLEAVCKPGTFERDEPLTDNSGPGAHCIGKGHTGETGSVEQLMYANTFLMNNDLQGPLSNGDRFGSTHWYAATEALNGYVVYFAPSKDQLEPLTEFGFTLPPLEPN